MKQLTLFELLILSAIILIGGSQIYLFTLLGSAGGTQSIFEPPPMVGTQEIQPRMELSSVIVPVSGIITSITDSTVTIKTSSGSNVNLSVDSDTAIFREGDRKNAAQLESELEAFRTDSMQVDNELDNEDKRDLFLAPAPFEEIPVSLGDVRVGDKVSAFHTESAAVRILVHTNTTM